MNYVMVKNMELTTKFVLSSAKRRIANYNNYIKNNEYDNNKIVFLYSSYYKLTQIKAQVNVSQNEHKEIDTIISQLIDVLCKLIESKEVVVNSLNSNVDALEHNIDYFLEQYKLTNKTVEDGSYVYNFTIGLRGMIDDSINGMKLLNHFDDSSFHAIMRRLKVMNPLLDELLAFNEKR